MSRLTQREFWDAQYREKLDAPRQRSSNSFFPAWLKQLVGKRVLEYMNSYEDYLLWDVIYKKYLPTTEGATILEVGSAPGDNLIRLQNRYGFVPYGVEYSENGVILNRRNFILHNIDPNNVIQADFFSVDFQNQYKQYFDIVISRGFIEHFTDVDYVIEKHLNILTNGGYLIVNIPNLKGLSHVLTWIFAKETVRLHNLDIMTKREFSKLFDRKELFPLFCDYYGTFESVLVLPNSLTERYVPIADVLKLYHACATHVLNIALRVSFRDKGAESRLFSPFLLFIGVKNSRSV